MRGRLWEGCGNSVWTESPWLGDLPDRSRHVGLWRQTGNEDLDLAPGLVRRSLDQLVAILAGDVRHQPLEACQVDPSVAERLQQDGMLPGCSGHADPHLGIGLRERCSRSVQYRNIEDTASRAQRRRASTSPMWATRSASTRRDVSASACSRFVSSWSERDVRSLPFFMHPI